MWSTSARTAQINYAGLAPEMGMFVVAPASSFHHSNHQDPPPATINFDPHSLNGSNAATALGVGVGVGVNVIPLLTATPCLNMGLELDEDLLNSNRSSRIQLWQQQQQSQHSNYMKKAVGVEQANNPPSINLQGSSNSGGGSGSTMTCQDCGNQAKKDCSHRRCRTCCKSRGYDCSTHVKSTWVPAARRRERQLMASATGGAAGSSQSTSGTKKPRLVTSQTTTTNSHTSTSNTTPPRSFDTSSSHHHHQDAGMKEALPGQVRAPATFKCVRVTAVDDGEDEYAYQAVVKIGGHVFKGFLYDQGVEAREAFPNLSELHLGGARNGASSSTPILDAADVYAASGGGGGSGGGFLGGSNYGNPMN